MTLFLPRGSLDTLFLELSVSHPGGGSGLSTPGWGWVWDPRLSQFLSGILVSVPIPVCQSCWDLSLLRPALVCAPQTHLTFGKEFTEAVEMKQVAQQEAERARFIVEKVSCPSGNHGIASPSHSRGSSFEYSVLAFPER